MINSAVCHHHILKVCESWIHSKIFLHCLQEHQWVALLAFGMESEKINSDSKEFCSSQRVISHFLMFIVSMNFNV